MHTEVGIHSMNAYVWCWRKTCGSLDEIPSVTMGTCKRKFLINSNMTLTVLNLHQQTDPKVQQDFTILQFLKLKYFVLRSLNHAYISSQMSLTLRQCIISCLPKVDKPRQFLKNWRPISLLSVIYKIASAALAPRLRSPLENIISQNQSGFMSGRFIGKNTCLIYDILHYSQCEDIPGLLMLIDFQKAFDSVSWKFLNSTLKFFGFKQRLCKWIQVLNTNIKASVLQSGFLSEFIDIERGCRHGDPISSRMFIICAQVMLLLILNNKSIKGISVNGVEQIINQFADDTTLVLDGSKEFLVAALNTIEIFGSMSGLKINTDKTKLIWIGKKRYSKDKINTTCNFAWGATDFNLLGINFSTDLERITELNFSPAIKSIKKMLHVWHKRYLTPIGKIAVIKTLAISKLNHLFTSVPSPNKHILKEFETVFFNFSFIVMSPGSIWLYTM